MTIMTWEEASEKKQAELKSAIPDKWIVPGIKKSMAEAGYVNTSLYLDSILPKDEVAITSLTMTELAKKIASNEYSSYQVAEVFCHRASLANQIVNCCVEIFFDEALERAKYLDKYFEENGSVVGSLHGVPVSLKDQVDLVGKDSSIGYTALLNKPAKKNAVLADLLLEEGAVFYVKTAVPMAMFLPETFSNVIGYTHNSVNIKLAAGGSSGGEGALIGAGSSCIGFGTDIGGSIRIPSAFQGLYALKPSNGRIPYMNITNSYSGQELIPSVVGPMARSLEDIHTITKMIVDKESWKIDPKVMNVPWRDMTELQGKRLTFGFWKFDGTLTPHPPIQRALKEAEEALVKRGHNVVEITFPSNIDNSQTLSKIFGADCGKEVISICSENGEPPEPTVIDMIMRCDFDKPADINMWFDISNKLYAQKQEFYASWAKSGIDAIVAPVWPSAAYRPYGPHTIQYTSPFNTTDCASVVLPVTSVDAGVDIKDSSYKPLNELDEEVYNSYDAELFHNMPVCLQVVTKKLEEEKALAIAAIVDSCFKLD
ncbi:hypothetical protein CANARDRAFT_7365 [[Candida] arabinofermentans NRRL YB-2248]|uniref:amidase n=1 Tax=[Candida] arabinofermentans NRRL YB-2248 TaxID=983967 RepID=A0A1E4T2M9_9ASCO|nr:hypothetical protein CANARDRAFT_7365 [[Candida] arabinofermentans NRRL YB-2248]